MNKLTEEEYLFLSESEIAAQSVQKLRAAFKETGIKVPKSTKRKADFQNILYRHLFSEGKRLIEVGLNVFTDMTKANQTKYMKLLTEYQEAVANVEHCKVMQTKLKEAAEGKENPIVEKQLKQLEAAEQKHEARIEQTIQEHSEIPNAPPLFSPMLDVSTHEVVSNTGMGTIKPLIIPNGAETKGEIKQEIEEAISLRSSKNASKPQTENERLLEIITNGRKNLKNASVRVLKEKAPEKASLHEQLMHQLRQGHVLRPVAQRKLEEEEKGGTEEGKKLLKEISGINNHLPENERNIPNANARLRVIREYLALQKELLKERDDLFDKIEALNKKLPEESQVGDVDRWGPKVASTERLRDALNSAQIAIKEQRKHEENPESEGIVSKIEHLFGFAEHTKHRHGAKGKSKKKKPSKKHGKRKTKKSAKKAK
jgi:hypothetical protein